MSSARAMMLLMIIVHSSVVTTAVAGSDSGLDMPRPITGPYVDLHTSTNT
jgi:hypothetical protein